MKLFVDDIRPAPEGWQLARTIGQAIRALSTGLVEEISLDHDIACKHPECFSDCILDDFMAVAEYIALMPHRPKIIRIHTGNIGAGARMADLLGIPYTNEIFKQENY